jgi:sterol desaturase/sphingolipid hydroxylase (fatty acid hydroxylase superfamily)
VQHESKFLWRFHSKHHAIDTPSPFSAVFIHPLDATLQVGTGTDWHKLQPGVCAYNKFRIASKFAAATTECGHVWAC